MDYDLSQHRADEKEATRILQKELGYKQLRIELSVRYRNYKLWAGNAAHATVGEYGDDPADVAQRVADYAEENDSVEAWANFNPVDSFGNRLGGPNEQT
jgi:hypothetical protein